MIAKATLLRLICTVASLCLIAIVLFTYVNAFVLPSQAAVERAVTRLDMTSFPNSTADRARFSGGRKLAQLGRFNFIWSEGVLEVSELDESWLRTFRPLRGPLGRIRLCFTDLAQNGGTYYATSALELSPTRDGLYRARRILHRSCSEGTR